MITTRKLTISAMVVALYIVVLYLTQSVSFGAYQIRIATSLYALAYAFPFLVIPMGIGNLISNFLFGGLGILDMMGGFGVGILTTGIIGDFANHLCSSALCTIMAQPITWPSILAIGIEPHRRSNNSSSAWLCFGESIDQPS